MSPRGHRADAGASHHSIEQLASVVRRTLCPHLGAAQPLPGVPLFESLGDHKVPVGPAEYVPLDFAVAESLPYGVEGETRYDREAGKIVIAISEDGYRALERGEPRVRFSVGHEIGHGFQHGSLLKRMSSIPHSEAALLRKNRDHSIPFDTEWQADTFAAALLMPAEGLEQLRREGRLAVSVVASTFAVSHQAARFRIDNFSNRRLSLLRASFVSA